MIKQYNTERLFYKKWLYKIECKVKYAISIKHQHYLKYREIPHREEILKQIFEFLEKFEKFRNKEIQTRAENNRLNIFCNDVELFNDIKTDLNQWVVSVTVPFSEKEKQLLSAGSPNIILRDRYFQNRFLFRVNISTNLNEAMRKNFHAWLLKFPDKFHYSKSTSSWLSGYLRWTTNPFIYVLDESSLSMIYLYLGNNVKSTDKCILRCDINSKAER